LKLRPSTETQPFYVIDGSGHSYNVVSEQNLNNILLTSEATLARQFQNWVLHCVLPNVLLNRFKFVVEERGGTTSDLFLDPKDTFYGLPDAHADWVKQCVLQTIREEGGDYTDREYLIPPTVPSKRLKAECMMRTNGQTQVGVVPPTGLPQALRSVCSAVPKEASNGNFA
jgi:hypothetical protein